MENNHYFLQTSEIVLHKYQLMIWKKMCFLIEGYFNKTSAGLCKAPRLPIAYRVLELASNCGVPKRKGEVTRSIFVPYFSY